MHGDAYTGNVPVDTRVSQIPVYNDQYRTNHPHLALSAVVVVCCANGGLPSGLTDGLHCGVMNNSRVASWCVSPNNPLQTTLVLWPSHTFTEAPR